MYVVKELQTNKDLNYIDLKELDDLLDKKEKRFKFITPLDI